MQTVTQITCHHSTLNESCGNGQKLGANPSALPQPHEQESFQSQSLDQYDM